MTREHGTDYGAPLTDYEIEALRCLIGSHKYKDVGNEDGKGRCVTCGEEESDE